MKKLLAFIFAFVLGIPLPLAYADNMRSNVAIPIPIPITLLDASTLQAAELRANMRPEYDTQTDNFSSGTGDACSSDSRSGLC
jgi:hypothetical protein